MFPLLVATSVPVIVVPLRIFAAGLLVFVAADLTYTWITVHSSYLGGDPVDTLWFVAVTILFIAASCQLRARPGVDAHPLPFLPAARPSVLPYVAVAVSYLLLVLVGLRHVAFNPLGGVLVGSVSIGTVAWVPVNRTWLRVRVARWSSRSRKLR